MPGSNIFNMNILELSAKAQRFYEGTRSRTLTSGYDRNILIREDYENALFVDSRYAPKPGDNIFRCRTINQQTIIELVQQIPILPNLEMVALQGKFTQDQWKIILNAMNGIIHTPEIDPRDKIAGEIDDQAKGKDPVLGQKILRLNKTEGYALLQAVQTFWNGRYQLNEFINKYL